MFSKEDILARLQDGDSIDTIAYEISTILNEARAAYEETKREEEIESKLEEAKNDAILMMLTGLCDYLQLTGNEDMIQEIREIEAGKIAEVLDNGISISRQLASMQTLEFGDIFKMWF